MAKENFKNLGFKENTNDQSQTLKIRTIKSSSVDGNFCNDKKWMT